jgi:Xaa-Pro aminopeptidase
MNSFAIVQRVCLHTIIGSGNNANVLHYIENNQQCKGDLILLDVGAGMPIIRYDAYHSGSGKFSDRQKQFTMRFKCKKKATKMLVPGYMETYKVGKLMTSSCLDLDLLDKADVQNENQTGCLQKIFHARNLMGLDPRLRN